MTKEANVQVSEGQNDPENKADLLRNEISVLLGELKLRGQRALDLRHQAKEHPAIVAAAGLLLVGGVAYAIAQGVKRRRDSHKLSTRALRLGMMLRGLSPDLVPQGKRKMRRQKESYLGPIGSALLGLAIRRLVPVIVARITESATSPAPKQNGRPGGRAAVATARQD